MPSYHARPTNLHPLTWILYRARENPLGIWLKSPDPDRLKRILTYARQKTKDPELSSITIRISPARPKEEIWVVNLAGQCEGLGPPTEGTTSNAS